MLLFGNLKIIIYIWANFKIISVCLQYSSTNLRIQFFGSFCQGGIPIVVGRLKNVSRIITDLMHGLQTYPCYAE